MFIGRPARVSGSNSGSRLFSAPSRLFAAVVVNPVPGPRCGVRMPRSGFQLLTWKNWVSSAGCRVPRLRISTFRASPVATSAQMSIWPIVDAGSAGTTRSPEAARPATRCGGSTVIRADCPRLAQQPAGQRRRQEIGGPRQPDPRLADDPGQQLAARIPDVGRPRGLIGVPLTDVGEHVDPPAVRGCLPHLHLGHAVQQRRDVAETGKGRQPERGVAFRVARVGHARGGEDAGTQRSGGHRRGADRPGAGNHGEGTEHGHSRGHQSPSPPECAADYTHRQRRAAGHGVGVRPVRALMGPFRRFVLGSRHNATITPWCRGGPGSDYLAAAGRAPYGRGPGRRGAAPIGNWAGRLVIEWTAQL